MLVESLCSREVPRPEAAHCGQHDRGEQAGPVRVEQRVQGPADPIVVEHCQFRLGQPEQVRAVAGGPFGQPVDRLPADQQVDHHQPHRGGRCQLESRVSHRQHAVQQRRQPQPAPGRR